MNFSQFAVVLIHSLSKPFYLTLNLQGRMRGTPRMAFILGHPTRLHDLDLGSRYEKQRDYPTTSRYLPFRSLQKGQIQ